MPLNEESRWEKAFLALPILVKVARNPDTALYGKYPGRITYGQLGKLIGVSPADIGNVCGHIRYRITRPLDLPYISCLVVNAKTGYPTEIEAVDTPDDAKRKFKEFSSRVYEYARWEELLDWNKLLDRLVDDQVNLLSIEELELEVGKYPDDIELKGHLAAALVDRYLYGGESQEPQSEADFKRLGEIVRDLPQDRYFYPRIVLTQYGGKEEESIEWLVKYATASSQENEPFDSDDLYFGIVFPFALSKELLCRLIDALCESWPESAAVFTLQGLAKTFDEKTQEDAIDDFVLALSKDEEYWLAAWLCAQVYAQQKNWRAARNYFHKALKSQTAQLSSDIHFEFAWSLGKLKAFPDEEKHCRLCLELDPDFPYARNSLGWSLYKQGRYKEALKVFDEAIERGNDKKYPLWNKARTLKKLGRFQQAIETWKQYIYRGKLTKFAQQEIARLEVLIATEKAGLSIERPDGEGEEDTIDDTGGSPADDGSEPAEPKTKLIPSGMPSIASKERWLECMIEEQIQKDNAAFGRRLKMYDHPDGYGRQYAIPAVGRIDLLVEDMETDDLVVVELKKGQFGVQAIEQISRYITWVRGNLAQKDQEVSGIICVYSASQQLQDAAKKKTGLDVFEYDLTFQKVV